MGQSRLVTGVAIVAVVALAIYVWQSWRADRQLVMAMSEDAAMGANSDGGLVYVRVVNEAGELSEPVLVPKVVRTQDEWKKVLTDEQFRIMRTAGTEAAFCGGLLNNKNEGVYTCVGCNLPLFASDAKFESGTGWPSFYQPVGAENILERADFAHGMVRTEILCPRCESHLGHLFPDGPKPTGLRYCLNSESLKFVAKADMKSAAEHVEPRETAQMVIAGGCFWCVEAVFEEIDGVLDAVSGYAGGEAKDANYEAVCSGTTGHAEAVRLVYDPAQVSYEEILQWHFSTHDPTTLNRQGNDAGPQYRSTIFYANEDEKKLAEAFLADLKESGTFSKPVVTTLEPLETFYPAEPYHQNYVCRNPGQGYVRGVALPKVKKVREMLEKQEKAEKKEEKAAVK